MQKAGYEIRPFVLLLSSILFPAKQSAEQIPDRVGYTVRRRAGNASASHNIQKPGNFITVLPFQHLEGDLLHVTVCTAVSFHELLLGSGNLHADPRGSRGACLGC